MSKPTIHEIKAYRFGMKKRTVKVVTLPAKESIGEATFAFQLKAHNILFEREVKFHPERKWRFDFTINARMAIEIEGGTWIAGRHNRGSSIERDLEKYNEAARLGWVVFRFTTGQVKDGSAIAYILKVLGL